jgi:uncharacterized membrane protein YgdD (TMEM256/DUF423 family)
MRFLRPSLLMWLTLAVVMFGNGAFRVLVLQPRLGESLARQLATVSGIVIVVALTLLFVRRLAHPRSRDLLKVGLLWLVLTLLFEFGMGAVSGASWETMLADYDLGRGRLWPLALLTILVAPWLWGALLRRRGEGSEAARRPSPP